MAARITLRLSNAWAYCSSRPRKPGHQLADGRNTGGRIDLFLRLADALAHPGEIQKLHASSWSGGAAPPADNPSRYRASASAESHSSVMPVSGDDRHDARRRLCPRSESRRRPAAGWSSISRAGVTGTLTRSSARYSRSPETRISRHRMTTAASSDQPWMVSSAASINRQDATRSLSAIGSSIRPSDDCCAHMRAR